MHRPQAPLVPEAPSQPGVPGLKGHDCPSALHRADMLRLHASPCGAQLKLFVRFNTSKSAPIPRQALGEYACKKGSRPHLPKSLSKPRASGGPCGSERPPRSFIPLAPARNKPPRSSSRKRPSPRSRGLRKTRGLRSLFLSSLRGLRDRFFSSFRGLRDLFLSSFRGLRDL